MPITVAVLCAVFFAIGWLGHVLWTKRTVRGERDEYTGCYPINNPWTPTDPITKALNDTWPDHPR